MQPILIIVLATLAGVPLGLWLRHNLATLGYRNPDEADLPEPGPRWWVVWASILAIGSASTAAVLSNDHLAYLSLLPLAVAGPWMAAIDFDVLRIPNSTLVLTAAATLVVIAGTAAETRDWQILLAPVAAAAATGAFLAGVHFVTKGGIGFGDVKLGAVIGLAVGPLGLGTVWLSILLGSLAALLWNRAENRSTQIPFGPWLLCGAWAATLAAVALE